MQRSVRKGDHPMRRLLVAAAVAAMTVSTLAAPASADQPAEFTVSNTFPAVDVCTGNEVEVTLTFDISIHEHRNNWLGTVQRSGSIEPGGYTMLSGNETFVVNQGGAHGHINEIWRNDEGSAVRLLAVFVFNAPQGEVKVDQVRLECVGA